MAKINAHGERETKGNSEDSLLVIYIFHILKKYSSPDNPLSTQDVMDYLEKDYSIGNSDKSDAQKKKVRRHLDTLHECYGKGCINKIEGKTRKGHDWYYDASRDKFADEGVRVRETLSEVELEFIIDLISATKVLNAKSTLGMVDKLLKKTSLSEEDRERRIKAIKREAWTKNKNDDLVAKKEIVDDYIDVCRIRFDYEGKRAISAVPCGWLYIDGICYLQAKVGGQYQKFSLSKIHDIEPLDDYDDPDDYGCYDEDDTSNFAALDSLFGNIPFIKTAIKEKRGITFKYLSYVVQNNRVVFEENTKNVLPHSLVFNDGKYYLIGIDEDANETSKVGYFRVDLIVDLDYFETKIKLSDWNKQVYDTIERAREIEKHPLMVAGQDIRVDFLVLESALDRVRDAYGSSPIFHVTKEKKIVPVDSSEQKWNENHSISELPREKVVKITVRTTEEEAFRWALANADAVELVYPPVLRHKLRRIAPPIHRTYAKTMADKVQANVESVFASGRFKIYQKSGEDLASETFKILNNDGNNDVVNEIKIFGINADQTGYAGSFTKAKWLDITKSQSEDPRWIANLTELVNIHLSMTSISNVSWLENLCKLKVVRLVQSPITDLSVLCQHQNILFLELRNLNIRDIGFIEKQHRLLNLRLSGCPIEDYSPLLRIKPLDYLEIDEKAVEAIGMENLIKHHPDAVIEVQQKIDNRKI